MTDHWRDDIDRAVAHEAEVREAEDRLLRQALDDSHRAVDKADAALQRRLDLLNEFRAQAAEEQATFQRRDVADAAHATVLKRIDEARTERLENTNAINLLRAAMPVAQSDIERLETIARAALPLVAYEERHRALGERVSTLEAWRANLTGRTVGFAVIGGLFIAVVSSFLTNIVN